MSDNFNNNIKQLGDILANENISESLINILSLLANSSKKKLLLKNHKRKFISKQPKVKAKR